MYSERATYQREINYLVQIAVCIELDMTWARRELGNLSLLLI